MMRVVATEALDDEQSLSFNVSLRDVMPWSYIWGFQNARHKKEMIELERRIAKQDLRWILINDSLKRHVIDSWKGSTRKKKHELKAEKNQELVDRVNDQIVRGIVEEKDLIIAIEEMIADKFILVPERLSSSSCPCCMSVRNEIVVWTSSWNRTGWPTLQSAQEKLTLLHDEMCKDEAHIFRCNLIGFHRHVNMVQVVINQMKSAHNLMHTDYGTWVILSP